MLAITNFHGLSEKDIKHNVLKSKDIREKERWITISSSIEGLSVQKIASILNRDESTIRTWISSFNSEGSEGLLRKQPTGKKKD